MTDTFEFTLNNPLTEEQWDMITDVNLERTNSVQFQTKSGNVVEFVKVIRCKDCKHFEVDHFEVVNGLPLIVAHEICTRWGDGCKTSENGWCFMAEPKENEE